MDPVKNIASYSNDELLDIVYHPDNWDIPMMRAAENMLIKRESLPEDIQKRRTDDILAEEEKLAHGKSATANGLLLAWIGVFGVLGLIIGYNYAFSKTSSLYTGKKFHNYNEETRETGRLIFIASLTTHTIFILYKFILHRY